MPQTSYNPNVEESGIVGGQEVTLTGEYVAGRDINIEEKTYVYTHAQFSEINLEPYKSRGEYIAPMFTELLLNQVLEKHLLIIGGHFEFYKNDLIRHLAALILENRGIKAREWVERAGNPNPVPSLAEEKEPTTFLFPYTSPQDVSYDLGRIADIAAKYGHYVLISTNLSEHAWKLPAAVRSNYWFEVPQSHIYYPEDLTCCLIKELEKAGGQINFENKVAHIHPTTELVHGISVEELASQLETVDKIQVFVRLLGNEKQAIGRAELEKLLQKTINNQLDLLSSWFLTLNEKEQETAIALSLFDGLYDDQFFEATERVVKEAWDARQTSLKSLDYCDLDSLFSFFNVQQIDANRRLVYSKFPRQRQEFFKAVWYSHRRRLLAALPVLESLIHDAENIASYNWELYGTSERKERLLQVTSEVLSDLSILHLRVVEPNLLRLATNRSIKIQGVTAKALARWRAFGHENQLFETLERWREEMHIQEMINHISKTLSQEEEQAEEEELRAPIPAEAIVRATVALTLAYASTYDHPNQLSNGLIETFLKLLEDKNKYVRERYSKVTVPMVVSIHFWQLRESLPRLLNYSDLVYSVAIGIAQAYDRFPDKVEKLIDEWLDYVRQYPQYRSSGKKITHRDSVLITVILALAEIRYSSENAFNAKSAYEIIVELQKEEYHKAIEKYYFHFVLKQLDVHASEIDSTILDIIENLSHKRRPKLIQAFTRIYLNQRSRQKGGSITWRHNGHEFPVWLDGGRPPTEIERTMVKWLLEDNPSGQQIAIDTLYHFGEALDSEEIVFVEEYQDKNLQNREPERETPHIEPKEPVITFLEGNWISQIIGWFTLSNYAENIRPILWNILPVLALKQYTSEQNLSAVADKLRRYGASEGQEVAGFISRFAHYFNQFLIWRVVAIVALVILVVLILVALSG